MPWGGIERLKSVFTPPPVLDVKLETCWLLFLAVKRELILVRLHLSGLHRRLDGRETCDKSGRFQIRNQIRAQSNKSNADSRCRMSRDPSGTVEVYVPILSNFQVTTSV